RAHPDRLARHPVRLTRRRRRARCGLRAGSKVDRHPAGDETAARGVRRPAVGVRELGLRLRQTVGATADEAAEVEVQRERMAQAELQTRADLTAEVPVVLVE